VKVLLTGGAGFIGSELARQLVAAGHELVILDKLTYAGKREHLAGVDAEFVLGDVCDQPLVERLVKNSEAVIHAAAESHVTRSLDDAGTFIRTNVEGTRIVLEAAARADIQHMVHVSTDEVFGSCPPDHPPFKRFDRLAPGNPYAATKAAAEAFVHAVAHTFGFRATLVRSTNNYGPRQHPEKAIPYWIGAALGQGPLEIHGDGSPTRDWLHVSDFATGMVAILARGEPGSVYHFAGGNALQNFQVAERILALCGREQTALAHGPDRPGQDQRYALDDTETRAALGWSPRHTFEEGLLKTIEWYRARRGAE
jgi:dTDP-glucose 4,6-dehydratase